MSILDTEDKLAIEYSPAEKAKRALDAQLDGAGESTTTTHQRAEEEEIGDALRKKRILEAESQRVKSRVLFVTSDAEVFTENSPQQQHFIEFTEVFDEVHVFVLMPWQEVEAEAVRVHKRAWLYSVSSRWRWLRSQAVLKVAAQQLQFLEGFRPDVIVALDPFAAAEAAYTIAKKYHRPWQLQVMDGKFLDPETFLKEQPKLGNRKLKIAKRMLRKAPSIRTKSLALQERLTDAYELTADIAPLPQFFDITSFLEVGAAAPTKQFSQFTFTILFVGELGADSTLHRAIDAARVVMRVPTIGMVVIGTGSRVKQFRERAKLLKIADRVVFLGQVDDLAAHLRAADAVIVTDTTSSSEEIVLKAAAVGAPLVVANTEIRSDLFENGRSAFLVDDDIPSAYAQALQRLLDNVTQRRAFTRTARTIIQNRIEEDPRMYRIAYRDTIEDVLFAESQRQSRIEEGEVIKAAHQKALERSKQFATVDGVQMKLPT